MSDEKKLQVPADMMVAYTAGVSYGRAQVYSQMAEHLRTIADQLDDKAKQERATGAAGVEQMRNSGKVREIPKESKSTDNRRTSSFANRVVRSIRALRGE